MPRRRQPVRQDGEGLPAQPTNPAPCQDAFVLVVVDPESPPMPNDRVVLANRAQRLQVAQRNYPRFDVVLRVWQCDKRQLRLA